MSSPYVNSSPQNRVLTQHFFRRLADKGFVTEQTIRQFYSEVDERFLPDRYVVGTCPRCADPAARGDQCERCSSLLDPEDLISPRSALSGSADLQLRPTRHLFLRTDALAGEVRRWIDGHEADWSHLVLSVARKWLHEGLKPRCITRDLSWGVPVPRAGFEDKVFYVWFDAPVGYIGATREWADREPARRDYREWWCDASGARYVQFMAKDNLPFHTIFFPAMVLGTREPWMLPAYIKGLHWLTYYGGKFSTSRRRGVFLDQALALYGPDYWRYALLSMAPESDDADFTWERFAAVVNQDLVGIIGNLVQRVLTLSAREFGPQVPGGGEGGEAERRLTAACEATLAEYVAALRAIELRRAVRALRELWSLGNRYLDARAPWTLVRHDREQAALVLRTAIGLIRLCAAAASPVIPFAASRVAEALGVAEADADLWRGRIRLDTPAAGQPFSVPAPLFSRVTDADVARLQAAYPAAGPE